MIQSSIEPLRIQMNSIEGGEFDTMKTSLPYSTLLQYYQTQNHHDRNESNPTTTNNDACLLDWIELDWIASLVILCVHHSLRMKYSEADELWQWDKLDTSWGIEER